ncbi:hypothetical protein ES704_03586 [subsurface metagenome]|jgi:hypothetical protein
MNVTAEEPVNSVPEGRFDFTKIELLQEFLDAFSAFRKEFHKPHHQTLLLSIPTIAGYVAFGTFESVLGLSSSRDWSLLNSRIRYLLDEKIKSKKRSKEYLINEQTEEKIQTLISGVNMRLEKTEKTADSVQINLLDCLEERSVTFYYCKLCSYKSGVRLDLLAHLESHSLKELRNPTEES